MSERLGSERFGGDFAELLRRTAGGEQVRVIVELDVSAAGEGSLSPAEVATQRLAIASAQASLLQGLQAVEATALRQFNTLPLLALALDGDGLAALAADPMVLSVIEDRVVDPSLFISTELIGAKALLDRDPTIGGSGWAVAILDTGVDLHHAAFAGRIVAQA